MSLMARSRVPAPPAAPDSGRAGSEGSDSGGSDSGHPGSGLQVYGLQNSGNQNSGHPGSGSAGVQGSLGSPAGAEAAARPGPEAILPTYETQAEAFARLRGQALWEAGWLRRMLAAAPGRRVLDLGCGTGRPIAAWLAAAGAEVTGVDGAAAKGRLFRAAVPGAGFVQADMRRLSLGRRFDALLAWDSFFHLAPADQRATIRVFAAHAAPGAALLFTSGPRAGEAWGQVNGAPVYHASLDPEEYRAALAQAGFSVLAFAPEDPECDFHTVWLARFGGGRSGARRGPETTSLVR